jgi:hypothetical protein
MAGGTRKEKTMRKEGEPPDLLRRRKDVSFLSGHNDNLMIQ